MAAASPQEGLRDDHTPEAISTRLAASAEHSYLGDGILGAIDGTVTTFAIVAGASGARLGGGIALVLGLANVLADGFSMAVGNYMKAKADREIVDRARASEEHHIETIPHGEREEIRQIFAAKGFSGEILDQVVAVITRDRRRWVDTMITEELGLRLDMPVPLRAAWTTFLAFLGAGLVPLLPLFLRGSGDAFLASAVATGVTFFLIGVVKGRMLHHSALRSGLETLLIGGGAALLAYLVGSGAREWTGV